MGWGYGMGGGWLLMTLWWVLLIAVVVALVVWIFPRETRRSADPRPAPTPRDVLDQRLARGEIDIETYRTLRQELSGTEPSRR